MNRAGVSLLRDRGPAAPAQDEMGWPPFLIRKDLSYTPTTAKWLPRENFCWWSRPLPPSPTRPSIHLYPSYSNSTCSFSSTAAILRVQRSFCLGGEVTRPRLQSRVHSTSSHGHQHRGQMKGSSRERRQNESREERSFIRSILSKFFFLMCWSPFSLQKVCVTFSINTLKIILVSSSFSCFLILLSSNYSTLDVVLCDWCQGLAEGRKKGRKHHLSDWIAALASWFLPTLHVH